MTSGIRATWWFGPRRDAAAGGARASRGVHARGTDDGARAGRRGRAGLGISPRRRCAPARRATPPWWRWRSTPTPAGPTPSPISSASRCRHPARARPRRRAAGAEAARPRGGSALAERQRAGLAAALGDGHRDPRRPRAPARRALDAVLSAGQRGRGHRDRHSADGTLQRRLLRPRLLGLRHVDVPLAAGHPPGRRALAGGFPSRAPSPPPGPMRGPTGTRARCIPGRRTSGARRPRPLRGAERQDGDPRQRRRGPRPVAVLSRHRRLRVARARGLSGDPRDRRISG